MKALTICLLLLPASVYGADLRGVVDRVVDGDTLDLCSDRGEPYRVRLSGIDAPEMRQAFGKEARAELAGLVLGKAVVVAWLKKDRYGRLLGTVLVGSVNVNLELMRAGLAWYYRPYASDVPEIERLLYEAAELEARQAKQGLWQQQQAMPPWEWRSTLRRGFFRRKPRSATLPVRRPRTSSRPMLSVGLSASP